MGKKGLQPEKIIARLREAEVLSSQGQRAADGGGRDEQETHWRFGDTGRRCPPGSMCRRADGRVSRQGIAGRDDSLCAGVYSTYSSRRPPVVAEAQRPLVPLETPGSWAEPQDLVKAKTPERDTVVHFTLNQDISTTSSGRHSVSSTRLIGGSTPPCWGDLCATDTP